MRNLKITKTREYLDQVKCFRTKSDMGYVTCWHVIDADTGEMVEGGYHQGSNVESGKPIIPRKKDAQAYITGYHAAENGDVEYSKARLNNVSENIYTKYELKDNSSRNARNWFRYGVVDYFQNK